MIPTRIFESPLRVLLLFCALALMMTWPLCRHLTTHLPQGMDDVWQNLWNFWWWKTALVDLHQSPYHTRHLFFPAGTDVAFHTHSEINQLAALPVTLLAGPVAAYNLATLASFVLAGFGAYLLAREITGDARAAVLAGLVFAFFPHHMEQTLDHLNLATIEFLPFVCLYLLRLVRRGGFANALKLGGALALNALGSWHYALMTVLFLPLLLVFELAGSGVPRRSAARGLMVAGAFAALVVAPFAWPMVHALAHGANYARPFTSAMGVDPLFLFLPSNHHPVLGGLTARLYRMKRTYANSGFLAYVGFIPLILAIAAWPSVRRDRRRLAWYLIAFSFLVLALGAHPRINGTP
ncbi:MAG TPA: hypothetical protein VL403_17655, partial [Candidatus Kryptonia bacterium]|nr:hypothetical protein [Candidatus Kryptonia bacterium]